MAVNAFRFENFMSFGEDDQSKGNNSWIEVKPINLIFGKNSSGKSAIFRVLRLLKQSILDEQRNEPLVFYSEYGLDQGGFIDAIHNHDQNKYMMFYFRCNLSNTLDDLLNLINKQRENSKKSLINREEIVKSNLEIGLGFSWEQSENGNRIVFSKILITCHWPGLDDDDKLIFEANRKRFPYKELNGSRDNGWVYKQWNFNGSLLSGMGLKKDSVFNNLYFLQNKGFLPKIISTGPIVCVAPENLIFIDTSYEHVSLTDSGFINLDELEFDYLFEFDKENPRLFSHLFFVIKNLLDEFCQVIEKFLLSIEYIGGIRPVPQRYYTEPKETIRKWKKRGLGGFSNLLLEKVSQEKIDELNRWLSSDFLNLGESIIVHNELKGKEYLGLASTIHIKDTNGLSHSISDVGTGASQIIPVMIQSLLADNKTVLIEQPELHLHPSAQLRIAEFFITQVNRDNPPVFFLETHSEHILLRIRRYIAENSEYLKNELKLPQDQVRMYFLYKVNSDSILLPILFSASGDYVFSDDEKMKAFKDFFADDMNELVKISNAKTRIRNR
jgi:AAA15 family ATPase/GTPase